MSHGKYVQIYLVLIYIVEWNFNVLAKTCLEVSIDKLTCYIYRERVCHPLAKKQHMSELVEILSFYYIKGTLILLFQNNICHLRGNGIFTKYDNIFMTKTRICYLTKVPQPCHGAKCLLHDQPDQVRLKLINC